MSEQRHDPTYMQGGRRYWADCTCGWTSQRRRSITRALLDHWRHLLATKTLATNDATTPPTLALGSEEGTDG